jgi:hypothetical protein
MKYFFYTNFAKTGKVAKRGGTSLNRKKGINLNPLRLMK